MYNFHPLEVVSRWRDPQLQVGENLTLNLFNLIVGDVCLYFGSNSDTQKYNMKVQLNYNRKSYHNCMKKFIVFFRFTPQ